MKKADKAKDKAMKDDWTKKRSAWSQLQGLLEGWQGESDLWLKDLKA